MIRVERQAPSRGGVDPIIDLKWGKREAAHVDDYLTQLLQPASVLASIGALCGLAASFFWLKVVRAHYRNRDAIGTSFPDDIRNAAAWTALAMGLASLGYLLGRLTGEF